MKKLQVGKWYYLKFYDHVKDSDSEFVLELCGKVKSLNKIYADVIYWKANSSDKDKEMEKENDEIAKVVLSTIITKRKLPIN